MLKKGLALLLAAFMLLCLTACGGGAQTGGGGPDEGEDAVASTELGFQDAAAIESFIENFNNNTDGYAYMVESDAQTLEGTSFQEQGYSVYRVLLWDDPTVGRVMSLVGDFTGSDPDNIMNARLIYDPDGRLVLFKALFTLSNSANVGKNDNALSCEAMMDLLAALFPQYTEEEVGALYAQLMLPAAEAIDSFESRSDYTSSVELIEHFLTHCGYGVSTEDEGFLSTVLEYDCDGTPYRLMCSPYGEYQGDLYAIYWDVGISTPDDMLAYEALLTLMA